ncbi:DUF2637 domain-containing protein [Nocardiopsis sp. NPDC057823]|uniref:DUF2637 domain-containing protein n=1 Tax=Nocardiopsis sp. NPDC057823 TaxID=3346256 RepID=UPI00366C02B9
MKKIHGPEDAPSSLPYYATITGSLAIAVGLVVVSYGHIRKFAAAAGAAAWEAAVIAATVDALVVLSIAAIGHARGRGHQPPAMAKIALIVGILATTGANIHHGLDHGWMGIVVSLWVPVAAELAYQLAMAAVKIGPHGHGRDGRAVICARPIPVAAVTARVDGQRRAAMAAVEEERRRLAARPRVCGAVVTVAAAMGRVSAQRAAVAAAAAEQDAAMAARPAICGGRLVAADTLTAHLAAPDRPEICGSFIPVAEVTVPAVDDRPVICGRLVTVAELLARTPVADPAAAATKERAAAPKPRAAKATATAALVAAREDAVMEWLTDPDAGDDRVATATGADIVGLLAERDLGEVSERTARRLLSAAKRELSGQPRLAAV